MRFLMFLSLTLIFNLYYQDRIVLILYHKMLIILFCFAQYFIIEQYILTAINNGIVINKKASKI